MDFPLDFQKICQFGTRKLLLWMATIASIFFIVQFLSIPYGNVFLSLFPSRKVPLIGKTVYLAPVSTPKSEIYNTSPANAISSPQSKIYNISPANDSNSSNSSGSQMAVKMANESDLRGKTKHESEAKGKKKVLDYNSGLDEEIELQNELSPGHIVSTSTSTKARETSNGSQSGHSSSDNVKKNENALTLGSAQGENRGSIPILPASPSMASSTNLTHGKKDPSLSNSISSGNNNTLSRVIKPETVGSGRATSKSKTAMINVSTQNGSLKRPLKPVTSIAEMKHLLLESRSSSRSAIPRWPSVRDQEILFAKSQIEGPPILNKDRQLYAPLFHNVSTFKRSYELMEQTLKVYVYKEGAKPVFHQPETKGIYASEGWFMKQMEGNKHFSVEDPRKAHLFYLPFSTRRLEQFLYVPSSHSRKNMVEYLKNYLNLISTKYPFWNRTGGSDHFVVACHDWALDETSQHMSNSIRALCNADISEGFPIGKDVSLPETNVRVAKNPLRDLGGKPCSKRQILAFFAGSMHGYVRPILLQYWENKDPDMKIYGHMGRSGKSRANYVQHMKNSKYCICAKGHEVNSPRVVEAIFYECVPVMISDNFVPPFFDVLNWEEFAVFVLEKDIPNLKNILLSIPEEKYLKLQMMVRKVQQHFLWHPKPVKYDIFHMILHSVWHSRVRRINIP